MSIEGNAYEYITAGAKVSKINEYRNNMKSEIEEDQNIEANTVILNIEIQNIDRIENIHNHHKTH